MTVLGHVHRVRAAATIAATALATMLVGCSSDEVLLDASERPASADERPTYTDKFTVGSATFTTNLPDDARVFEPTPAESKARFVPEKSVFIVSWPGHDLSTISFDEFNKQTEQHPEMVTEGVVWTFQPFDCMSADTARNRDDTIDSTSPLNGQPLTYLRYLDASEIDGLGADKFQIGGATVPFRDLSIAAFVIKLDRKSCEAVRASVMYGRNRPDNPLKDFGYQLFVEGEGTVS